MQRYEQWQHLLFPYFSFNVFPCMASFPYALLGRFLLPYGSIKYEEKNNKEDVSNCLKGLLLANHNSLLVAE